MSLRPHDRQPATVSAGSAPSAGRAATRPAGESGRVAVLGLGRMGSAMAARLHGCGWDVVGWTRSGRSAGEPTGETGPATAPDAATAVAGAAVVVLALFDGPACVEVLDLVGDALPADAVVVNTATVGPDEAAALAERLGPAYVHAPVLGSTPAIAEGTLNVLAAAGTPDALDRARPVLEALGTVRPVADAATAAALKLVGNASMAAALLALRDTLQQADALRLPRPAVLDVLALGRLGGLVTGSRPYLLGPDEGGAPWPSPATFTVGALAKDTALLARASGEPLRSAAELADGPTPADAGVAQLATAPGVPAEVLEPLLAYARGHATGDPAHFRAAFLPTAHVEGRRDGAFCSWTVDEYCARFTGRPAPDEADRARRIDAVDVHETVATAAMTLWHGPDRFTDVFLLVLVDGRWRIANKAYHRAPAG